jgi:hypothetical protein
MQLATLLRRYVELAKITETATRGAGRLLLNIMVSTSS